MVRQGGTLESEALVSRMLFPQTSLHQAVRMFRQDLMMREKWNGKCHGP